MGSQGVEAMEGGQTQAVHTQAVHTSPNTREDTLANLNTQLKDMLPGSLVSLFFQSTGGTVHPAVHNQDGEPGGQTPSHTGGQGGQDTKDDSAQITEGVQETN